MLEVVAALTAGIVGVSLGAWLSGRNEKNAATERLLVEALNDLVGSVADVANGIPNAQARYASALARIGLHASPQLIHAFRLHQEDATTITPEGRRLLVAALQQARHALGHKPVADDELAVLLFGSPGPNGLDHPLTSSTAGP